MFSLANLVLLIALLALVLQPVSAAPTGLSRRKCAAKHAPSSSSSVAAENVGAAPSSSASHPTKSASPQAPAPPHKQNGCFPALGFNTPDGTPDTPLDQWWCSRNTEYAFLGFSYPVNGCPSKGQMLSDFKQMRNQFNSRYVRTYAACDNDGFWDDLIDAAYESNMGVMATIWFGFDVNTQYKDRAAALLSTLKNNPRAPYTCRDAIMGSESIFDNVISDGGMAAEIKSYQAQVAKFGVKVSTSDMVTPLKQSPDTISVIPSIYSSTLPFFAGNARSGGDAWGAVQSDIETYVGLGNGKKKIILDETGWPTNTAIWQPNSGSAVASASSAQAYYELLDSKCQYFKNGPAGGTGWTAHVWSDDGLDGWGVTNNGNPKYKFHPRTSC